jgi:putative sterol carrier protein
VPVEVPAEYLAEPDRYFLEWLPTLVDQDLARTRLKKVEAIAQFELTGDNGGAWYFELDRRGIAVKGGAHPKPSFTLTMPVGVWRQLNTGELGGLKAYMRGDIRFSGSRVQFFRVANLFRP